MFKNWKIGTKILIAFLVVTVVAVGMVGFFAFTTGSSALEEDSFNKLTAVREMKASQIEDYFQTIENQIITFSEDRMIIDAMRDFDGGLHVIQEELDISDDELVRMDLANYGYYDNQFLPRLIPNKLKDVDVDEYWPEDEKSRILQYFYISSNPNQTGEKHHLNQADDGSSYSEAHEIYHPIIRDYLDKFGYYDIFLVDVDTGGHIAYSVFKEVDYGTSLVEGPYTDTNFAEAYRAARDADAPDFVKIVDFEPYDPSYNAPASFIASPIFDGDTKIGVLVFQMPIDRINDVMTNNHSWAAVGLGESGETYIVGDDFTLRNQSRFLIEDSENYFKLIDEIGTPLSTIARIRNLNSTIGLQEVKTDGTLAAQNGSTGTSIFPDYRGVPVLSAYKPLNIRNMDWVIMSEIDQAEAFAAIRDLGIKTGLAVGGLIAVIVVLAILFSRTITRPLEQLTQTANQLADGNLDVDVQFTQQENEIGVLASSFDVMRLSMKDLIGELEDINRNLEQKVEERTVELEQANERVRSVIDNAPDAIITIDTSQEIVMFNPSAEAIFGYKAEEVVGKPLTMLMPDSAIDVHPGHVKGFLESNETMLHMDNRPNVEGLRKDGSIFPAEASIAKMLLGEEIFFTAILRDVTERKEAEKQLHLQSSALISAVNGIVITDVDGNIEWVNPAFTELTGYSLDELIGQNPRTLKSGEHDAAFYQDMWTTIISGEAWRGEMINMKKDGSLYPEEMTITPVVNADGNIINFVAIKQDITERKDAEAQLRVLSEALRSAANGIAITDPDDKVEWVNPSFTALTGYSSDEIVGEKITILSSQEHPEEYYTEITEMIRAGQVWRGEMIKKTKDGRLYSEDLSITPIVDRDGEIVNYVSISQDITERKKSEAQLRSLSEALRSAANGVAIIDLEDRIQWVNPAFEEITGYSYNEIRGGSISILNSGQHPDDFYENIGNTIHAGGEWRGELTQKRKNGSFYIEELSITPILDEDGKIESFVSIRQDITERKELERQLKIANERMSIELNFAREIQMSMLPLIFPAFPLRKEVTLYATLHPAREVGGDFYDFYFLDDDHLCFVIGDVAGKGAPGALLMAVSKTLIKSRAADDSSPSSILTHVNNELSEENESAMFVTVFLGILNVKTGELVYTNAGHNPPYIKRSDGILQKLDAFHGPVIGAMPELTYKQDSDTLGKNDAILLYTDGVTEALDIEDQLYSDPKLVELLLAQEYKTPKEMVEVVAEDVKAFQGDAEQADDITILALQYFGLLEETGLNKLQLKIKNQLEQLGVIEDEFFEFALQNDIPAGDRQKVSIVLDELLNNVVNYAFQDEEEHEIEVEIEYSGERLVITITDEGIPFNPFQREKPDISADVDDREIGGLGIHLVRSVMDEYDYQRHINKNVVRLVKMIN
jgi:PAS domain S-box-containing protein